MANINIYPVLVTWKAGKDGRCPIHISVDLGGKRAAFPSIQKKILPVEWDDKQRRVKDKIPNATLINGLLQKKIREIEKAVMDKQLMNIPITAVLLKSLTKNTSTGMDFFAFAETLKEGMKEGTKINHQKHINKLKEYAPSLSFGDINYAFLNKYYNYLKEKKLNTNNTVWTAHKFIRQVFNQAIRQKVINLPSPFAMGDAPIIRYEQGIPKYQEWAEVLKLKEVVYDENILTDRHRRIGYTYLLQCFSGMRFGDASTFNKDKHTRDTAAGKRLVLRTKKNGEIVSIAFTKDIEDVVKFLTANPLPKMMNQVFNEELKIISGIAKIQPLNSHMGRHTFAMRCAELGMSIDDVQELLGHGNKTSTKIYFRIKNNRLDDVMKRWDQE